MPNCKSCGNKYSFLSAQGDGLCNNCRTTIKDSEKHEAEQKVLNETRSNLEEIVKFMTGEAPLCFTFINRGITEKKSGGVGFIVGGLLGGIGGAMVGNAFDPGSAKYSGHLGIILVTKSKVIIGFCAAPFLSACGQIAHWHVELFRSQLAAKQVTRKEYEIRQILLNTGAIVCGGDVIFLRKSELYVNNKVFSLSEATDIHNAIAQNGAPITTDEFISRLKRRESPMTEELFADASKNDKYIEEVFSRIICNHKDRDELVRNFPCLVPPAREALETRVRREAALYGGRLATLILCITLVVGGVVAGIVTEGFVMAASFAFGFMTIFAIPHYFRILKKSIWCRDIL